MRQPVVITLIIMGSLLVAAPLIMGSLLVAAPLIMGAFDIWAITQAIAQLGRGMDATVPGQDSSYPWVCLGMGVLLIGVGIVGEWRMGRKAVAALRSSEATPAVKAGA